MGLTLTSSQSTQAILQSSVAVPGSTEGRDSFPAAAVGAGLGVGVLVAVASVIGLILAALLVCQRRRSKSYETANTFRITNPVYDGEEI